MSLIGFPADQEATADIRSPLSGAAHRTCPLTVRSDQLNLVIYGGELSQGYTGVAVYVRFLLQALARGPQTLRWAVAVPESRKHLVDFLPPHQRVIVPGQDTRGYLLNEIAWQTRIARWVKVHAPQAVFHTPFHFWSPVAPKRMMMTAHDCIEMRVPEVQQPGRFRRLHRRLCWSMIRHAAQVVAVSEWTRQELVKWVKVPADRIAVVYNWTRSDFSAHPSECEIAAMREAYGLPPRYIAYLGGFRAYKNVEVLIEGWLRARQLNCPPLVLAGQLPPENGGRFYTDVRGAVERARAKGQEIVLPGAIEDRDLPLFYAGASLFVSPSRYEGFGYPAVEASACGTPVLVADRSAYKEIFPERFRFPADNPRILAERMHAALRHPQAYIHPVDSRFTEDRGKHDYEALVNRLLGATA